MNLALLAHHAWLTGDAIVRTLVRLARHRNLLEWNTSAQVQTAARLSGLSFVEGMLPATVIVIAVGVAVFAADPDRILDGTAISRSVATGAAGRLEDQHAVRARSGRNRRVRRCRCATPDRSSHLALLRDLREQGESLPAAGQFPGGAGTGHCSSQLADQLRAVSALRRRRARFWLDQPARDDEPSGGNPGRHGRAAASSWPFFELDRHAQPASARTQVRVDGRQRQPGRNAAAARAGLQ